MAETDRDKTANLASSSDPSRAVRLVTSHVMRAFSSPALRSGSRRLHELARRARREPHRVDYFHQVDDAYSHLAAQALTALADGYEIEIVPHLVRPETGPNLPEPELLRALAVRDSAAVAPHYGLQFPSAGVLPKPEAIWGVQRLLAGTPAEAFAATAVAAGEALWSGDDAALAALEQAHAQASDTDTQTALAHGSALRTKRGHYSGAMYHYAGEWYWGVDRLYHLERRLAGLGAARRKKPRFPRPAIAADAVPRADRMTLEVFPSLRSPYTAIVFQKTIDLARATGVRLEVRPVLPMVMRGVPATFTKGRYIFSDAAREAETLGAPFGTLIDPIGEPVRRAYSLWPWAQSSGRGAEFLAAFLRCAFAEGVDTATNAGLEAVLERAGLSWSEARTHLGDLAWEAELERNRLVMYEELGLWGVPSYRLRGPESETDFSTWGQDRLWLVAQEIARRGSAA